MKKAIQSLFIGFCSTLLLAVFLGCTSVQITEFDDGSKQMVSKSKIREIDFYGKNFFTINTINPVFSGFDITIFRMMKDEIVKGSAKYQLVNDEENEKFIVMAKKGEILGWSNYGYYDDDTLMLLIYDSIYDEQYNCYVNYNFALAVFTDLYGTWVEVKNNLNSYLNTCNQNIDICNTIIKTCSNPTIQKSKVVQVPYVVTERYWVAGRIGSRTNSSYGSTSGTPGHYETRQYTAYKEEIEYYTVPDPNYNPTAVAQAKKDLQYWNNQKDETNSDLLNLALPFSLISF